MVQRYLHTKPEETFRISKKETYVHGGLPAVVTSELQPRKLYDSLLNHFEVKSEKIDHEKKEIKINLDLYNILYSVMENPNFTRYVNVPGIVTGYKVRDNGHGVLESDVEPIVDEGLKAKVEKAIKDLEGNVPIGFWSPVKL